jgi:hypothetical protein
VNPQAERLITRELNSDEKLLWSGQPEAKRLAMQAMPIFLFGIPWTAFACFWVAMACWGATRAKGAEGFMMFFPLFGLPFILIGLAMLISPLKKLQEAKKTYYGVTNKRALIVIDGKTRTVQAYDKSSLGNLVRVEYGNKGDLTWSPVATGTVSGTFLGKSFALQQTGSNLNTVGIQCGFFGITNPHDVERLLTMK